MKNLIQKRRREANLSQGGLGELCGWDQGRISHYETGRRSVGLDELETIAKALNISIHALIDSEEGNKEPAACNTNCTPDLSKDQEKLLGIYDIVSDEDKKLIMQFSLKILAASGFSPKALPREDSIGP